MSNVGRPRSSRLVDRPPRHSAEEIDLALSAVVSCGGNFTAAHKLLISKDIKVHYETLRTWVQRDYPERYWELREKFAETMEKRMIAEYRDTAIQANEAARLAITKAQERLEAGEDENPAKSAQALSVAGDRSMRAMLSLSGRPSVIHETRNVQEIVRGLVAAGVAELASGEVIEGEVEDGGEAA